MDGLDVALGIGTLLSDALPCFETTAFEGFGLSLGVSFHRRHDDFLRVQCFSLQIEGNRTQFEASEMKDRTQVAEVYHNSLKMNRLHETSCAEPHEY